jgi:transcriptional regulator with XRE-family HTH domain/Tol biopolymer transport system component
MKGSLYRERDYAFGQLILTVRTKLKLTQTELAEKLGVRRRAVIDWEGGLTYPTADHLKHFVTLALEHRVFSTGREAEEIRALWQAARQKVLLDEVWLGGLLSDIQPLPASRLGEESDVITHASASPFKSGRRVDWGNAPDVASFYGREWELDLLAEWLVEERCRVVSVLGQGGIGKSALATKVMHHVAKSFEVVIWRSLRDVPSCEALLDSCLQVLAPQGLSDASSSIEKRQDLLLECLRNRRVLLVYDNVESFLEEGEESGRMRADYEGFARVLRRVAETEHQSCWLLTSREKSSELVPLEGSRAPVRALRLARLDAEACQQLLAEKGVAGSTSEHLQLVETYAGNPLALKIVAQTIVDLFDGQIAPFLDQGEVVFGGVRTLLDEQYIRLSAPEQSVLVWLAILREPVNLQELLKVLGVPVPRSQVLEAVESLHRRSLIEPGPRQGSFTLHAVVMEYVTARLIAEVISEIKQGRYSHLVEYGLELASCKEYVRQTQQRFFLVPILAGLRSSYPQRTDLEKHLLALLKGLRAREDSAQGYGPANVLALLREYRGHLRGLDLSHLVLRSAYVQDVEMQDTILFGARLEECAWTSTFGAIWAVAISPDGDYWAAGSRRGEMWVGAQQRLHLIWQAHSDVVRALAFSSDGRCLASGSYDSTVKVWEVESGTRRWIVREQPASVRRVAWSPDGKKLASAGDDGIVSIWNASDGRVLKQLRGHHGKVNDVIWSRDGKWLASGGGRSQGWGDGGELFVWEMISGEPKRVLSGHPGIVYAVAWGSTGGILISGGSDGMLRWWDVERGECVQMRQAHQGTIQFLKVSPDGRWLSSCGDDGTITIWELESGEHQRTLRRDRPYERLDISGVQGLTQAQRASLRALGAIEMAPVPDDRDALRGNSQEHTFSS